MKGYVDVAGRLYEIPPKEEEKDDGRVPPGADQARDVQHESKVRL